MREGCVFRQCTRCRRTVTYKDRRCPACDHEKFSWGHTVDLAPPGTPRDQRKKMGLPHCIPPQRRPEPWPETVERIGGGLGSNAGHKRRCKEIVSKVVSITTPLTTAVAEFVSEMHSKGAAAARMEDVEVFRQAVRAEARRLRLRVRTGLARYDPHVVWPCDLNWSQSPEEAPPAHQRAVNLLAALLDGPATRARRG